MTKTFQVTMNLKQFHMYCYSLLEVFLITKFIQTWRSTLSTDSWNKCWYERVLETQHVEGWARLIASYEQWDISYELEDEAGCGGPTTSSNILTPTNHFLHNTRHGGCGAASRVQVSVTRAHFIHDEFHWHEFHLRYSWSV